MLAAPGIAGRFDGLRLRVGRGDQQGGGAGDGQGKASVGCAAARPAPQAEAARLQEDDGQDVGEQQRQGSEQ